MPRWLLIANENSYWVLCLTLLLTLAAGLFVPRRDLGTERWKAWVAAICIAVIGFVVLEIVSPWLLKVDGVITNALRVPALARMGLPTPVLIILSLLLLDLLSYAIHLLSHQAPWLWRLHQVHHSDTGFDATTALLHHPLEALVTTAIQFFVLSVLGLPLIEVVLYGVLLNLHNPFVHSNIRLSNPVDRVLRLFIVTPDMHRLHHSARMDEGNSNFGMLFPWWDWLLGSYRADMADGQQTGQLGLPGPAGVKQPTLVQLLLMPVRAGPAVARGEP